jgi:formylglycine-generating enzyme required for sulfatase activity
VNIDYELTCDDKVDIVLMAQNGSTALTLPETSLSGDLYGVAAGKRRIVWDPTKTAYTNTTLTQFSVALATVTNIPTYMIVDLTKSAGAEGQVQYVYPGDARLAADGNWYSLTNDVSYMTTNLVLRRVQAGSYRMQGSTSVRLTKDFYVGVFEVTQWQWYKVTGGWKGTFSNSAYKNTRPVESVKYDEIRGATNSTPAVNWPLTGYTVSSDSFMGKLRTQSGLLFDLPTEAQWEYACRAGTTSYYNDGLGTPSDVNSNEQINVLGRYAYNGGQSYVWNGTTWLWHNASDWPLSGPTNGTALVGSYLPNNWGLYDTHGNVYEMCLDWYNNSVVSGDDPAGQTSSPYVQRVQRGGSRWVSGSSCSSGARSYLASTTASDSTGFRLVRILP